MPEIELEKEQMRNTVSEPDGKSTGEKEAVRIGALLLTCLQEIGNLVLAFGGMLKAGWTAVYRKYLKRHVSLMKRNRLRRYRAFSRLGIRIAGKFFSFFKFFADAWRVVQTGFRKGGIGGGFRAFGRGVQNNSHFFVTIINYALPVAAILCVVHVVNYVQNLEFAIRVEYNGEHIGYIQDETVFEEAATKLQQRLTYLPDDEVVDSVPRFAIAVVDEPVVKTSAELTDAIIENSSADMVEATGVYIDGELMGVVRNYEKIDKVLTEMLNAHRTDQADERVEFTKSVESESGLYLAANLVSENSIIEKLTSKTEGDVFYTVQAGDAPSSIAQQYNMTTDELVAMNPGILDKLLIGQSVLVNKSVPFLPVKSVRVETYEQSIPYETTVTTSDKYYEGEWRTITPGVAGKKSVTAEVSYVDGVEISRTVLSETVLSEPTTAVVAQGTKVMQKAEITSGSKVSNSGMINPIQSKVPYVSQRYKGSSHNGIDIAFRGQNGYGTPIVSVLPGTVTYAGWRGTYGYLVIVDHGNGYQTWYAHCSKLYVSVGQKVVQGESIAAVGNTGRSFGNHLHFRVIANGVQVDPLKYIPGF